MATTDPTNVVLAAEPNTGGRSRARIVRWLLFATILLGVLWWAAHTLRTAWLYVHETDARITADMVSVSSRVSGWIVERPVEAGTRVHAGDVIAVIDGRDARLELDQLHAEAGRIEAEKHELTAKIAMTGERNRSHILREQAQVEAAEALVDAIEHEYQYYARELERAEQLFQSGMLSAQTIDQARTAHLKAKQELIRAKASVATARAELETTRAERHELDVLTSERETLEQRQAEVVARVERQKLNLADRVIVSPIDGVVSKAFVEVGEYVEPGRRLVLLHDPQQIYVEANIRETDIRRVAVGQSVIIEVDAYPEQKFFGTVERIGDAATSQFALLPSANPSGNFTKVTQRLPVRIGVTQDHERLRPGMMVEVFVDARDSG